MSTAPVPSGKVSVGYFTSWGIYARNYKPFESQIPIESLTHILYAFAKVDRTSGEVTLTDPWADEQIHYEGDDWNDQGNNLYGNLKQLYLLKQKYRHLKVLLSIGGWTYSPDFAKPCMTREGRSKFVESSLKLLEDYGFDGLDIDWEYPKNESEANDYVSLLRELRYALDSHATRKKVPPPHGFQLTIAAPCGTEHYQKLKLGEMHPLLSFINLMAYDYAGSWSSTATHQANLFSPSSTNPNDQSLSTDKAIRYYVSQGVPIRKLVLGIPLYGRSFSNTNGIDQTFSGVGEGSWEAGSWDYKSLPRSTAMKEIFDPNLVTCHTYDEKKRELISYDNVDSAKAKAEFVKVNGLGGIMFWELSGDRDKGQQGNLVELMSGKIGETGPIGFLDRRQNWLKYDESKWDNMRKNMGRFLG